MKIGNTPLKELKAIERHFHLKAKLFAKYEKYNPAGSVKDRIALAMIEDAEEKGLLKPGSTIIEPTSGNTGIGLAYVGKEKGYRVVLSMPESMSIERRNILKSYGAELVLTEASKGMKGAIAKAKELNEEIKDSIILGQFDNPANPEAHYKTTGPEIYKQTKGEVAAFVAGVGTGGTVSGVGRYLKEQNKDIRVVAVEPLSSPMISKGEAGPHQIQGIGAGFTPNTLDRSVVDAQATGEKFCGHVRPVHVAFGLCECADLVCRRATAGAHRACTSHAHIVHAEQTIHPKPFCRAALQQPASASRTDRTTLVVGSRHVGREGCLSEPGANVLVQGVHGASGMHL